MSINPTWLRNNAGKPVEKEVVRSDRDGLYVCIFKTGRTAFQMRYRFAGKPAKMTIGNYPEMSLAEAREENGRLRKALKEGHNPKLVKSAEKLERQQEQTFEEAFTEWFNKHRINDIDRAKDHLQSVRLHLFPQLGDVPITKIKPLDWFNALEEVAEEAPSIVHRSLSNLKLFYKWHVRMGIVESNPVADFSASKDFKCKKGVVTRTLSDEEIQWLWLAFKKTRVAERTNIMYKLMLLTTARMQELRLAKKEHFDLNEMIWTVPKEISKNGFPIVRPIIPEVRPLVERAMKLNATEWMFVSDRTGKPSTGPSIRDAVDSYINYINKWTEHTFAHWTPHDLRRTARTKLSAYSSREIAEVLMGHTLGQLDKVYNQYQYLNEKRDALTSLYYEIAQLVGDV